MTETTMMTRSIFAAITLSENGLPGAARDNVAVLGRIAITLLPAWDTETRSPAAIPGTALQLNSSAPHYTLHEPDFTAITIVSFPGASCFRLPRRLNSTTGRSSKLSSSIARTSIRCLGLLTRLAALAFG